MPVEIPERLLKPRRNGCYNAGWLGKDGTLHAVDCHINFKPRGWKAANERYAKEQRAQRRAEGLPIRGRDKWGYAIWQPRKIDTYRFLSERGFTRLEVQPGSNVTVESYPHWGGGFATVLTEPAAEALLHLTHTSRSKTLHLRSGWGAGALLSLDAYKIHTPRSILQEVHA